MCLHAISMRPSQSAACSGWCPATVARARKSGIAAVRAKCWACNPSTRPSKIACIERHLTLGRLWRGLTKPVDAAKKYRWRQHLSSPLSVDKAAGAVVEEQAQARRPADGHLALRESNRIVPAHVPSGSQVVAVAQFSATSQRRPPNALLNHTTVRSEITRHTLSHIRRPSNRTVRWPSTINAAVSSPALEPIAAEPEREKAVPGVEILTSETAKPLREMGAIASERAAPSREPARVYAPVAVRVRREHTSRSSRCCHCTPKKKLGAPQTTESSQTADSTLVVPEYLDTVVLLVENCRQSVAVRVLDPPPLSLPPAEPLAPTDRPTPDASTVGAQHHRKARAETSAIGRKQVDPRDPATCTKQGTPV
ncbi:hypothetical protein GGTG_12686 [Gaeumannomyces tritici R3-111a-1]|uniref:Uncharacterized protein n=1 Tax=Gaeumannomyces tritici (strain R3-111a-1) TaxID=644352 RepID=J3PGQ7_GAET3|nr:hypothetical protein GGTG_12686 [Gaeumannomyces tritici R3-111a-1]EJT69803.1 hypothetical protein GGTG_12686 [Gaeumannomyces tritici R3-111a-1]